jgi:hypothetical protein
MKPLKSNYQSLFFGVAQVLRTKPIESVRKKSTAPSIVRGVPVSILRCCD